MSGAQPLFGEKRVYEVIISHLFCYCDALFNLQKVKSSCLVQAFHFCFCVKLA